MKKLLKKWTDLSLFTKIMIGFVLGIIAGLLLGTKASSLAFLGTILTRLLTMVVAPLVLGLLICAAADVKDFKTLGKIGGKTIAIFLGSTAIAVAIGLVASNLFQIGAGFTIPSEVSYDAKDVPSVATIPLNLKCAKKLGVSDKIADFVIPFGAVMNMNGTAIYEAVAVVFAAQVFGINLTITEQIMVMITAVLASIGTAGIPGSGLVMLTIVLNAVGLPLETIGLLAGIDRILNMARVIPNIVGDAAAAVVVAKSEGELHPELVDAATLEN